jgi:MraZ protein
MTSAFAGNVSHTIDPKGRVTIPATYREALGEGFTIGLNNQLCAVALYPAWRWREIEQDLARIPPTDVTAMRYVRLINGNSFPQCELDGQGRALLPSMLRVKTGMDKQIRFVGMGQCLEIWDEARYQAETQSAEAESEKLLDYVNEQYYKPRA